jgi:CRISPR-associated protein Cas5d
MGKATSKRFRVRARGPLACFTRPELKAERVSYEVMTPSAARGLLEAILWKPAIVWRVHEIAVLAPIAWTSFRRNEVTERASARGGLFAIEDRRAQRNTVGLKDVDYVVTASFEMTRRAGPDDNMVKFEEMFDRRIERGQHFQQPYFGCREFAANVEPVTQDASPIETGITRPLGLMLYDLEHNATSPHVCEGCRPLFFDARLESGVLRVPPWDEVLRANAPKAQP